MDNLLEEVDVHIVRADQSHVSYAEEIVETIFVAAQQRGTGIARRTREYIT